MHDSQIFINFATYHTTTLIMNKYTILAIDVDGTLQNSNKCITEHTRNTIIRAQEQGMKVVISSGRPTYGIAPLAEELELERFGGYVLAFNGGEITEWATRRKMYEETLPSKYLPFIYNRVKENGFEILSCEYVYLPNNMKEVTPEQREKVQKLLDKIEEDDDVQNVFHNMVEDENEEA